MIFYILTVGLLLLTVIYIPSSGGEGVNLPVNIFFLIGVGIFLICIPAMTKKDVRCKYHSLFIFGLLLIMLPWGLCIMHSSGVILLFLMLVIWLAMAWIEFTPDLKRKILCAIFIIAVAQCFIGMIQSFMPNLALSWFEYNWLRNQGRPYGIFQQVNLFASFLATAAGCGCLSLFQEPRLLVRRLYLGGLSLLAFMLALNQSRTGELGAIAIVLMLSGLHWRSQQKCCLSIFFVMLIGATLGSWVVQHMVILVDGQPHLLSRTYIASNLMRWNIIRVTWQMILDKPWSGWGYGSFPVQFARYLLAHPELKKIDFVVITHPHNELLFAWFQGGIIALCGMLLLVSGWVNAIIKSIRRGPQATGAVLLIVPLLLHLNLEYPFYQSFIHLGVFVLLLRIGFDENGKQFSLVKAKKCTRLNYTLGAVLGVMLLTYSGIALYANAQLTCYERQGLEEFPVPMPWYFYSQPDRASFDSMVALLVDYNNSRNNNDLSLFMQQAVPWSERHLDKNVLLSMRSIYHFRGDVRAAAEVQKLYSAVSQSKE